MKGLVILRILEVSGKLWSKWVKSWFYIKFCHAAAVYLPHAKGLRTYGLTAKNSEKPVRLPNGFLCPRVEAELRTYSGEEIGSEKSNMAQTEAIPGE